MRSPSRIDHAAEPNPTALPGVLSVRLDAVDLDQHPEPSRVEPRVTGVLADVGDRGPRDDRCPVLPARVLGLEHTCQEQRVVVGVCADRIGERPGDDPGGHRAVEQCDRHRLTEGCGVAVDGGPVREAERQALRGGVVAGPDRHQGGLRDPAQPFAVLPDADEPPVADGAELGELDPVGPGQRHRLDGRRGEPGDGRHGGSLSAVAARLRGCVRSRSSVSPSIRSVGPAGPSMRLRRSVRTRARRTRGVRPTPAISTVGSAATCAIRHPG